MKIRILLILVAVIFLISCQKEIFSEEFTVGQDNEFSYGNEYYSNNKSLKLTITEINDSRCPSDVVCIWQGEAVVKIKVETEQTTNIELSTFDNLTDTVGIFSITLIDVSPYPVSTENLHLNEYVVTLKVDEL